MSENNNLPSKVERDRIWEALVEYLLQRALKRQHQTLPLDSHGLQPNQTLESHQKAPEEE